MWKAGGGPHCGLASSWAQLAKATPQAGGPLGGRQPRQMAPAMPGAGREERANRLLPGPGLCQRLTPADVPALEEGRRTGHKAVCGNSHQSQGQGRKGVNKQMDVRAAAAERKTRSLASLEPERKGNSSRYKTSLCRLLFAPKAQPGPKCCER